MTESTLWEEGVGELDVCCVLAAGRARVVWRHGAPLGDLDTHGAVRAPGGRDVQWKPIVKPQSGVPKSKVPKSKLKNFQVDSKIKDKG